MTQRIVRTLGGKMLQDTIAGKILTPHRPFLIEYNSFISSRMAKTETRPAEIEVLLEENHIPKGLTDKILAEQYALYKEKTPAEDWDFKDFLNALKKTYKAPKTRTQTSNTGETPSAAE